MTGRNAVFLAERGYEVDAIDRSRVGLVAAVEDAEARGVADRLNPVRADLSLARGDSPTSGAMK